MTKNIARFAPVLFLVALAVLAVHQPSAHAQSTSSLGQTDFQNLQISLFRPATGNGLYSVLGTILNFFLLISGLAAFFYILYGGFLYLTAGGDAARATQGRTYIVNAIIGVVIVFVSFALARFIINFTQTGANGTTGGATSTFGSGG